VVEKAGYAPRLLAFERLPGCWLLVVMEYLDSAAHWNNAMTKPADPLRAAVKVMHDADYVHGDLRSPNALVKDDKVCVSSVGFLQSQTAFGKYFLQYQREVSAKRSLNAVCELTCARILASASGKANAPCREQSRCQGL
jgi:hypothetical protein